MQQVAIISLTHDMLTGMLAEAAEKGAAKALQAFAGQLNDEKMLSVEQTCKLFIPAITRQTLHTWTNDGLIKKHVIGRSVYYKQSEVMEAVKEIKKWKPN